MTAIERTTVLIPHASSRFIARLLVGVLLFAQFAVAAYACGGAAGSAMSGAAGAGAGAGAEMMMAGTALAEPASENAGHGAMDPAQPNLCAAHCQSSQQNAGAKPLPDLPAAVPVSLYPLAPVMSGRSQRADAATDDPPSMADPPHAVLHCCLRI
ncbi:MAG: hypothetical protein J0L57_00505 [Burkholderiales bacterium]|nr:hypothetical protein [Burkholderiales bacterium]